MNSTEVIKIITAISAAFPNYQVKDKALTVDVWTEMLQDYTYEQISKALKAYILTNNSGFAPSIGQLVDKVHTTQKPGELSEMEAWALVSRALRNGYYHAEEEFAKLPPMVQRAVGMPSQLRNWAVTDMESIENVVQSNFMRTYRSVVREELETAKLPVNMRQQRHEIYTNEYTRIETTEHVQEDKQCVPMPAHIKQRLYGYGMRGDL